MRTLSKTLRASLLSGMVALSTPVAARQPGVPTSMPPGASMGVPVGASPPPGLYFSSRSGYADLSLYDGDGNRLGADVTVKDTALQFLWVPELNLWGGQYKAFVTVPVLDLDQTLSPPFGTGTADRLSLGQIEVHPFDLSWQVAPGTFVSTGFSVFAPTGSSDATKPVNTQGNFWTFAPSLGFSHLRDGWNLSLNAIYFTNTRNEDNDYRSGDEIQLHMTAMKDFDGWSIGPVGYYRKQVTNDDNKGLAFGGTIAGKAEQLGLGLGVTRQFGPVQANLIYTRDVIHRNTLGGNRLWLNFTVPFGN
ncbi:MAG: transporter [Rhizobiales bacterium]|nr:transporter [Hyphomicrobiales bacterium]